MRLSWLGVVEVSDVKADSLWLMNGDCLERMKDIESGSVDMVLADPPYGTTACKWDSIIPLDPMWRQLKRVIKPNGAIVMTASQPFTSVLVSSNMKGFKYDLVWDKPSGTGFLNAKKMPLRSHESLLVFYEKLPIYNPQMTHGHERKTATRRDVNSECYGKGIKTVKYDSTSRYPRSICRFSVERMRYHPTQKPVALMEYLIKTYTSEGEAVLDFTMGSGTTGVAAIRNKRHFIGIELDETYFDVAKSRIMDEP
jgi:DNA modification methylase